MIICFRSFLGLLLGLILVVLFADSKVARADDAFRCDSTDFRYQYCVIETGNRVKLVRQYSRYRCVKGSSWGYDRHGVWVDRGCAADFRLAGIDGVKDGSIGINHSDDAATAVNLDRDDSEVPSWAIGTFTGFDVTERTDVTVMILPGGLVSGHAGRHAFRGRFEKLFLEAGRIVFRVERLANGFVAIDQRNAEHTVTFRRSENRQ